MAKVKTAEEAILEEYRGQGGIKYLKDEEYIGFVTAQIWNENVNNGTEHSFEHILSETRRLFKEGKL